MGAQQIAESIGNTLGLDNFRTSKGLFDVVEMAKNNYRTVDYTTLTPAQRRLAGINDDGTINIGNWLGDKISFFGETNDSKALTEQVNVVDLIGSTLLDFDVKNPEALMKVIDELTGRAEIAPDSPLAKMKNSAVLNTVQQYLKIDDLSYNTIVKELFNYNKLEGNRQMLGVVSNALGLSPQEIVQAINKHNDDTKLIFENKPKDPILQRLEKVELKDANGKRITAEEAYSKISSFTGLEKASYDNVILKADIMTRLADASEEALLQKYNVKPDSFATRLSNLNKSVQSVALLNFSPSYLVNNWINNMVTRTAVGVGGELTQAMKSLTERRGLFNGTDTEAYSRTAQTIKGKKTVDDGLNKISKGVHKITDKLKGLNVIDIEGAEKAKASSIGANQYYNATWKRGIDIPEIPEYLKAFLPPDKQEAIYRIIRDSANAGEVRDAFMKGNTAPKWNTITDKLEEMITDPQQKAGFRDWVEKNPEIGELFDKTIDPTKPETWKKAFDLIQDVIATDVDTKFASQMADSLEDLTVRVSAGGMPEVAEILGDVEHYYTQLHEAQAKSNERLFEQRSKRGGVKGEEFDAIFRERQRLIDADYERCKQYTKTAIAAMAQGMGLDDEFTVNYLKNIEYTHEINSRYYEAERNLFNEVFRTDLDKELTPEQFNAYVDRKMNNLKQMHEELINSYTSMNELLVNELKRICVNDDGKIAEIEQSLNSVLEKRKMYYDEVVKNAYERTRYDSVQRRHEVSSLQNKRMDALKKSIDAEYRATMNEVATLQAANYQPPTEKYKMSYEDTLRWELFMEEAHDYAKSNGDIFTSSMTGEPVEMREPLQHHNTISDNMSFEEASQKAYDLIKENEYKAGGDGLAAEKSTRQAINEEYESGSAFPLNMVSDADKKGFKPLESKKEYTPLKPDVVENIEKFEDNPRRIQEARCYPFKHNGETVTSGVYMGNKLVAYQVSDLQKSITVNGYKYPVLGVDVKNGKNLVVLVGDKPRVIEAGKPRGLDTSLFADNKFHPMMDGTTPAGIPHGTANWEMSSFFLRDILEMGRDGLQDFYKESLSKNSIFDGLTNEQKVAVMEWINGDLSASYNSHRYRSIKYGEMMSDAAMLNYSKRYGFDNFLGILSPYQFWMTRSMVNWGKRMIDKPQWFSMYSRIQKLIEKNKKTVFPSRMNGLIGIPMPNMMEGFGDGFYIDPISQLFPFHGILNAPEYLNKSYNTIKQNTMTKIQEMYDNEEITAEEYALAMKGEGDIYKQVFKELQASDEADTGLTGIVSTFASPPLIVDYIIKAGQGREGSISATPMTSLGGIIKAAGQNTPIEGLTNTAGNILQAPERLVRKGVGALMDKDLSLNTDGAWREYNVDRRLLYAMEEGRITKPQFLRATVEREGNPQYDQALQEVRFDQANKKQLGPLAVELTQSLFGNKETSAGQLLGTAAVSLFGGKVIPQGEHQLRQTQAINSEAYKAGMSKEFYQDHPNYNLSKYAYEDDPEMRMKMVAANSITETYYAMPPAQQEAVRNALGTDFYNILINKETRNLYDVTFEQLVAWDKAIKGNVPYISNEYLTEPVQQVNYYANTVDGKLERYNREKDARFPAIDEIQDEYYALDSTQRKAYLQAHPELGEYWDYNDRVKNANPDLREYFTARSKSGKMEQITANVYAGVNAWTAKQLDDYILLGRPLSPQADNQIKMIYNKLGTYYSYEDWLESIREE